MLVTAMSDRLALLLLLGALSCCLVTEAIFLDARMFLRGHKALQVHVWNCTQMRKQRVAS
jgi:hypothetical protein